MRSPGFKLAIRSISMAAVMPPPMTQTSDSWIGMALSAQGRGPDGSHSYRAVGVASDARVVTQVVGAAAADIMGHQIGDDMLPIRAPGQIAKISSLECRIEEIAANLERQRAESPPARLRGLMYLRDVSGITGGGRGSRFHEARLAIAMRQRDVLLVVADPPEEVVDGLVLTFAADGRRKH